jgi:hypothetical protein
VIIAGISTGDNTSVRIATAENIVLLTYFREADRIDLQFQTPGVSLVRAMSGFCVQEETLQTKRRHSYVVNRPNSTDFRCIVVADRQESRAITSLAVKLGSRMLAFPHLALPARHKV